LSSGCGVVGLIVRNRTRPLAAAGVVLGATGVGVAGIVSERGSAELQGRRGFLQLHPDAVERGQRVETPSSEIVVMDVDDNVTTVDGVREHAAPEGKYVAVSVAVKNIGDDTKTFWNDGRKLVDADGAEYEPDRVAADIMEHSNDLLDGT